MNAGRKPGRRAARRLLAGTVLAAGVAAATSAPASAATTATFNAGVLSVTGDNAANAIVVSRNAAGRILVNGGAIAVAGGTPTVANTSRSRSSAWSATTPSRSTRPTARCPGRTCSVAATTTCSPAAPAPISCSDRPGNDTLLGRGGTDLLFGGEDNDTITGGDADDQAFGQSDDDRMVWNQADDTDLNEGGAGTDTVEMNGANGAEQFTTTANGTRVCFDRVTPAPFAIDIGTSENLVVTAKGGDDSFSATGNLAALIKLTVDGGAGDDTLQGGNGADILLGGDGDDVADGNQGDDVGFLGAGDDTFRWDPGRRRRRRRGPGRRGHAGVQRQQHERDHGRLRERRPRAVHPQRREHHDGPERRRVPSTALHRSAATARTRRSTTCPGPTSPASPARPVRHARR